MKNIVIPIIVGVTAVIAVGIFFLAEPMTIQPTDDNTLSENTSEFEMIPSGRAHPEAISSGPLTITKYKHKVWDNIFMIISGLKENEKGNIRIFMPDGRLWKTIPYDGSVKENFNQYFKPDTSIVRKICSQEELVGIWPVKFDNNAYPSIEFEIINEHLSGPDVYLEKIC